jgi:hypothetical protein
MAFAAAIYRGRRPPTRAGFLNAHEMSQWGRRARAVTEGKVGLLTRWRFHTSHPGRCQREFSLRADDQFICTLSIYSPHRQLVERTASLVNEHNERGSRVGEIDMERSR